MPFKYTTVSGYFLQDDPDTDPSLFDYIATSFGLKEDDDDEGSADGPIQWLRLTQKLEILNRNCGESVQYKLLFMGRHGEGVHNVAEKRYGTEAWNAKWARLDGDDKGEWIDAQLTPTGWAQAYRANALWATQMKHGIPLPQRYYVSPLRRCLDTAELTFGGLPLTKERQFKATVKELLRETMGVHTCDQRSSKSRIFNLFEQAFSHGDFVFEDGFLEADELYQPDHRETNAETDARLRLLLDDVFAHDESECISLTSHSGAIASILRVVEHREFALQTGAVIPVLVRAEKVGITDLETSSK